MGTLKIVTLKNEGRLAKGDTLNLDDLGMCTVANILTPSSICVKTQDGKYHTINGMFADYSVKMVATADGDGK